MGLSFLRFRNTFSMILLMICTMALTWNNNKLSSFLPHFPRTPPPSLLCLQFIDLVSFCVKLLKYSVHDFFIYPSIIGWSNSCILSQDWILSPVHCLLCWDFFHWFLFLNSLFPTFFNLGFAQYFYLNIIIQFSCPEYFYFIHPFVFFLDFDQLISSSLSSFKYLYSYSIPCTLSVGSYCK